jgi:hypothetical protein
VREAIKDDWKQARTPDDNFWWENVRQSTVSPLWGFSSVTGDLFGHLGLWRQTGFLRAKDEEYPPAHPSYTWPSPPSSESSRSWGAWSVGSNCSIGGPSTGWGPHE